MAPSSTKVLAVRSPIDLRSCSTAIDLGLKTEYIPRSEIIRTLHCAFFIDNEIPLVTTIVRKNSSLKFRKLLQ